METKIETANPRNRGVADDVAIVCCNYVGERGEMPQPPNGAGQLPNGMQRMGQSENSGNTPPQLPEFKGEGGIGIGETGNRGIFRLFNQQLSGQISWLLPFASLIFSPTNKMDVRSRLIASTALAN
ncbi:hypothetical protein [Anoxybacillus sp. KU2-6(11)]|uniref:hypothetical protein n=1 Tax=Anoxybacillus sp. KU2-6(11) TaxID=1535751 RepID=UPI000507A207|nr:hypothetical protein [Anoxybacillus sp. KU2-6(11)]KFZ41616.1 hypothetical protein JS80_16410 [Anoxybacillus sp. KU2-6(11)]